MAKKNNLEDPEVTIIEPEETAINDPLVDSSPIEKDYANPNADTVDQDIMEQDFQSPIDDVEYENIHNDGDPEPINEPAFEPGKTSNPALDDAPNKTKNASAKYMADTALAVYQKLNDLGKDFCKLSEEKLQYKAIKGEIDLGILDFELPLDENDPSKTETVGKFIRTVNYQADEIFMVSDQFKDEARPILIEIFKKKGWGLTPEQRLLALVIEDAVPKVQAMMIIKSQLNQVLSIASSLYNKSYEDPVMSNKQAKKEAEQQDPMTADAKIKMEPQKKRGRPAGKKRLSKQERIEQVAESLIHQNTEPEEK